ncbi:MAG TPA: alpha-ketoglutarate-dependent dioxygenase AlkB [Gemmataceae bacterium]|nr:alpha-ketoglutarate-dependent dioxygenase AlkB [Gemmataceae bacterium]
MMERLALRDGGLLLYVPSFIPPAEADALFALFRDSVPWKHEGTPARKFPRLTAWYADPGCTYSYSGVTHHATPWTPGLLAIKHRAEAAAGTTWNSLLLNLYRDGRDSIGFHADDEPELGVNPVIGSISLGAERRFILKHPASGEKLELALPHGSLLVMGGTSQHHWRHGVPKTKKPVGRRINLTFRRIISPQVAAG